MSHSCRYTFRIKTSSPPEMLVRALIHGFNELVLRIRSLELRIPGTARRYKARGSVDGDRPYGMPEPTGPFDGETLIEDGSFTTLENRAGWFSWSRDEPIITDVVASMSTDCMAENRFLFFSFWGEVPVRMALDSDERWVLRERNACSGALREVLRIVGETSILISREPWDLALSLVTRSQVWSGRSIMHDTGTFELMSPTTSQANADRLAAAVAAVLRRQRYLDFSWTYEPGGPNDLGLELANAIKRKVSGNE